MIERVMNISAVPSYLATALRASMVRVSEADRVITIIPAEDEGAAKKHRCPLLGIAKDSNLTVEKFLEWKREDREREYEQELRS
ncbi:MAG: hypothetical protein LBU58_00485 [Clostridiales bacterium]|nr:hypothetical protein [Clostridiales bacterium]